MVFTSKQNQVRFWIKFKNYLVVLLNYVRVLNNNHKFFLTDAIPSVQILTPDLPTGLLSPQPSPTKGPAGPSKIFQSPSKPFSTLTLGRKIPITIYHKIEGDDFFAYNEKNIHFNFLDTRTLKELYEEIKRLSKCSGAISISSIRRDIAHTVVLKTLDLPSVNKVNLKCNDQACHQQFNSQMIVTGLSTEEMYISAKKTINELTNRIEELEKDIENEKLAKIGYRTECNHLRYQLKMKNKIYLIVIIAGRILYVAYH